MGQWYRERTDGGGSIRANTKKRRKEKHKNKIYSRLYRIAAASFFRGGCCNITFKPSSYHPLIATHRITFLVEKIFRFSLARLAQHNFSHFRAHIQLYRGEMDVDEYHKKTEKKYDNVLELRHYYVIFTEIPPFNIILKTHERISNFILDCCAEIP